MFGGNVTSLPRAVRSTATGVASSGTSVANTIVTRSKQTTMSGFLLDSMIVDGIKKKERAKAAKAKDAANKETK